MSGRRMAGRRMVARKSVGPHQLGTWKKETRAIRRSRRIQLPSENPTPPKRRRKDPSINVSPLTNSGGGSAPMEPRPSGPPPDLEPRYLGNEFAREMYGGSAVQVVVHPVKHPPKVRKRRAVANKKKDSKPKKIPYKQIQIKDFHKLLDTKDSSHLSEVQQGLYQKWISDQSFRPVYARDGYVAPTLHPMPVEVGTSSNKEEKKEPPEHSFDKDGKLKMANQNELWKLDTNMIPHLSVADKEERKRQKKVRRNILWRERNREDYNKRANFRRRKKKPLDDGKAYITTPSPASPPKRNKEPKVEDPMPPLGQTFPAVTPGEITEEQFGTSPALVAAFKEPVINQEQVLRDDLTPSQLALYRLLKTGSNDLGLGAQLKCREGLRYNMGDMTKTFENLKPNQEPSIPNLNKIKEVERFLSVEGCYQELIRMGFDPPRNNWSRPLLNKFQYWCTIAICGGTADLMVIRAAKMLIKYGVFSMAYMSSKDPNALAIVQDILLYSGANWWSHGAACMFGLARRCVHEFGGNMPTDPKIILSFYNVGRKLMMLLLQDGHYYYDMLVLGRPTTAEYTLGLVSDTHVARTAHRWKWTKFTDLAQVAQDLESWFPPTLFRRLNETIGGISQMVDSATPEQRTMIRAMAIKMKVDAEICHIRPILRKALPVAMPN